MKTNAEQHGGVMMTELSAREARVVPLALAWDRLKNGSDVEALKAHIIACYAADCPDMARRAERKLRGEETPEKGVHLAAEVFDPGEAQAEWDRIKEYE